MWSTRFAVVADGFGTEAAAEKDLRDFIGQVETGGYTAESNLTVAEYLDQWLPTVQADLRPTTIASYRRDVANISSKLGTVRLRDLTPLQIEAAYADLMATGGATGLPLSAKTVRNAHTVLRKALGDAEHLAVLTRNVARLARPPRADRKPIATWTAAELGRFLDHVEHDRLRGTFYLLVQLLPGVACEAVRIGQIRVITTGRRILSQ